MLLLIMMRDLESLGLIRFMAEKKEYASVTS
jgi:hypothetical protein